MITEDWMAIDNSSRLDIYKTFLQNNYQNEKHFCDVIEDNIELICDMVFNAKYISHKREYILHKLVANSNKEADFLIYTDQGKILVECKSPTDDRRQHGIQQLLDYKMLCDQTEPMWRYILLTSKLSNEGALVKYFNLPIEVYYMCNEITIAIQ